MSDQPRKLTPADVIKGESPLVLTASLEPVAGLDRFQPAGFPEVGHVIYKAPREDGSEESVCIVDSPASMANHLESVCLRGAHDYELAEDLAGMPYVRCVTGSLDGQGKLTNREVIVTSLTEGHRIASTYFLEGSVVKAEGDLELAVPSNGNSPGKRKKSGANTPTEQRTVKLQERLIDAFGIELAGSSKAHPPAEKWWSVFKTIFKYDPNALVHGVLFPQWQIKISRFVTAHLEAFGASRVDRAGVKFDRLGKTTSGQPIFAVDDTVANNIRATFILDLNLVKSFGRRNNELTLGLGEKQQEFLVALALWKIQRLLDTPFRFRSGCHLRSTGLKAGEMPAEIDVNIKEAIKNAGFTTNPCITDVYWPREGLYREGKEDDDQRDGKEDAEGEGETDDGD